MYSARVNQPAGSPVESKNRIPLLASLEVFSSLTTEELETVARDSRWLSIPQGGSLFAGEEGSGRLYAIREGEVLISKRGEEGRDISLATFVAGGSFGELDLFDHRPGDTSARCERDSLLLAFPAAEEAGAAERFFEAHPTIAAKVLHSLLGVVAGRIRTTNRLIAEKSPWIQELRRQVSVDKLTGLHNASFLEEELTRMLSAKGTRICLLMLKPDNFKTVNDTYGHQAGDRVLQLMAGELKSRLGERGTAVRYRGDVLAAVLPQCVLQEARRIAETIRAAMSALDLREVSGGQPLRITVSLGVAGWTSAAVHSGAIAGPGSAATLVERAYENLFTARNRGGDRVCAAGRKTGAGSSKQPST
jgi:diguanylate cyclase (GGDEF)-like protein